MKKNPFFVANLKRKAVQNNSWAIYTSNAGNATLHFYYGTNYSAGTGGAYISTSGTFTNSSDIKFKQNVVDLSYGLVEVLQLNPVSYQYILTPDKTHYGFIAQDIEKVLPHVVEYDEDNDGLGLCYTELIAVLTKAIQELNMVVQAQQIQINSLIQTMKPNMVL